MHTLIQMHTPEQKLGHSECSQRIEKISGWCRKWQITLAIEKKQAVNFTKKENTNKLVSEMDDTSVGFFTDINILGIIIDSGLNFTSHVKTVVTKADRKMS